MYQLYVSIRICFNFQLDCYKVSAYIYIQNIE